MSYAPRSRLFSSFEMISIGYFDGLEKKRVKAHCNEDCNNVFNFPAVTRKLRHIEGSHALVDPYQKPQRLINRLITLFSNQEEWLLDLFARTCIKNCGYIFNIDLFFKYYCEYE
ncbi:hypothetical protein O6H91_02G146000 [Diphasiastrum complanatum]|uniref:Uncharacterized protein n=1 Tax=Diphasiastrum complanatum TaxID=34168 RepID=A0ACC2ELT4_DIPCM|nr:hypothetical protein O6H91_02G146000 [Diphasiastrum complanatum]